MSYSKSNMSKYGLNMMHCMLRTTISIHNLICINILSLCYVICGVKYSIPSHMLLQQFIVTYRISCGVMSLSTVTQNNSYVAKMTRHSRYRNRLRVTVSIHTHVAKTTRPHSTE